MDFDVDFLEGVDFGLLGGLSEPSGPSASEESGMGIANVR